MFNHLYCNNVKIQKIAGIDSYNNPIIDEEITVKGKLEYKNKKVINRNGEEITATGELRLSEQLGEYDRIHVKGVWREIINITPVDDFSGEIQYYIVAF